MFSSFSRYNGLFYRWNILRGSGHSRRISGEVFPPGEHGGKGDTLAQPDSAIFAVQFRSGREKFIPGQGFHLPRVKSRTMRTRSAKTSPSTLLHFSPLLPSPFSSVAGKASELFIISLVSSPARRKLLGNAITFALPRSFSPPPPYPPSRPQCQPFTCNSSVSLIQPLTGVIPYVATPSITAAAGKSYHPGRN